jgi:asparagine synthase (glutamine-hydrolysing)
MCGIAGYFNINASPQQTIRCLERMIWTLRHRGPDGFGFYQDQRAGLAHARLSIIDLEGGWQPIHNEDKTLWIIFNGEIFNYPELRQQLLSRGHLFATNSDTEVIIHLYEDRGEECLQELNGQFALAIYDQRQQSLFLARDRMGIRPLYYMIDNGRFFFGSEIKAIFSAYPQETARSINPAVLKEIFTFWSAAGAESVFSGVNQLEPGHWLKVDGRGKVTTKQYWEIPFGVEPASQNSERELSDELRALLIDAVRIRLRADVPVGAYLSGGLDSSTITSLISNYTDNALKTFSVTFTDKVFDEEAQQLEMVEYLRTDHNAVSCSYETIGQAFPQAIIHTETPVLRTAPVPLFLLSALVRKNQYKVVLTGEGADEILGGYDIFKEAKVRAFIGANRNSNCRPSLLKRLYPYLALPPAKSAEYARKFFDTDASPRDMFYGHRPRWTTASGTHHFFTEEIFKNTWDPLEKLGHTWQKRLESLDFFTRAQFLESRLLLGNYLLSSQGDRMGMAHSVEGRYPFLDHRVVEFACAIPPNLRMKALNEKNILKKAMVDLLPKNINQRKKQPYMAPDILSFFGDSTPDYLDFYLSENKLKESGLFKPVAVKKLVEKCRRRSRQGFRENMAFVGILSSQIIYQHFVKDFQVDTPGQLPKTRVNIQ